MISEEALRQAAAEASDCLVRSLDEAGIPAHNFSARFERKIRRLIRRTRHPAAYRALIRVACVFLAFILGSGVFLAVNPEARAAFFGWVRTQYEQLFVYDVANTNEQTELPEYTLGWLPDGYVESARHRFDDFIWISYSNESGITFDFLYSYTGDLHIDYQNSDIIPTMVDNIPAQFYHSSDLDKQNNLIWPNSDGTIIFSISGPFDDDILCYMAENIVLL